MLLHSPLQGKTMTRSTLWIASVVLALFGASSTAYAALSDPPETGPLSAPPCTDALIGCKDGDSYVGTAQAADVDSSAAAVTVTQLTFQPHCINQDRRNCPVFETVNGSELTTSVLRAGDIVDMDIVIETPDPSKVNTIRSWIKFDPAFLEARSVELTSALSQPIPGEQAIDANNGIVKIGGGTNGSLQTPKTAIARVTFRVKSTSSNTTISFQNFLEDGTGETSVTASDNASLLTVQPTVLTVRLSTEQMSSSSSSAGGSFLDILQQRGGATGGSGTQGSSSSAIGGANSAFTLLQVQNVRVTSKDTNIFLGWQGLTSTDLAGYNVYYGTVSGKYINRRSVPDTSSSLVVRDLEPGTQYFLAVRGFNSKNQETVFSHEVSVVVGKPETSSAPLAQIDPQDLPPEENPIETHNGKNISGETGVNSTLALLALASAGIGTFFAWRRQLHLPL